MAYFAPDWLKSRVEVDWFERYSLRFEQYRLPKSKAEREKLSRKIGEDGHHLLSALYADSTCNWLWQIPSVETLRIVWVQQSIRQQYPTRRGLERGFPDPVKSQIIYLLQLHRESV